MIRNIIVIKLVLSLTVLAILIVVSFILQTAPIGELSILLISVLGLNIAFCLISLLLIARGYSSFIKKLLISYLVLVLGFLILDFIAGQVVLKKVSAGTRAHDVVHHELVPNSASELSHITDYDTFITTNNIGCRGENISSTKVNGINRILMLGDSFTMGRGVNDGETFSVYLEQMLNEKGYSHEVINCGVESYTPLLEYLQLKENIDYIKPDLVILNFDMGDLLQEYSYRKMARFDENEEIVAVSKIQNESKGSEKEFLTKVKNWIRVNMFLTSNALELVYKHSYQSEMIIFENVVTRPSKKTLLHTLEDYNNENYGELMNLVEQSMLRIKELCMVKGCDYIITAYPRGHQVNEAEWIPGRYRFVPKSAAISDRTVDRLERFATENNILFINTFEDFRNYKGQEKLYYNNDTHWTSAGHKVMAESLKRHLDTYFDNEQYTK